MLQVPRAREAPTLRTIEEKLVLGYRLTVIDSAATVWN